MGKNAEKLLMYNLASFANTFLGDSNQKAILRSWHEWKVLRERAQRRPPDSDVVGVTEATGICGMDALEKEL